MTTTFSDYAQATLEYKQLRVQRSTYVSDKARVNKLCQYFGRKQLHTITQSHIQRFIVAMHGQRKNKTLNEYLTLLRAVFKSALSDGVISHNPMSNITNFPTSSEDPQPFSKADISLIVRSHCACSSGKAVLLLGVLIGLRISETLALTWESIDFDNRRLKVKYASVLGQIKVPKNAHSERWINLPILAIELLRSQYSNTGVKEASYFDVIQNDATSKKTHRERFVFISEQTRSPFRDSKEYQRIFYDAFLTELGIPHRGPNQCRHTFASQALTQGADKNWIAKVMGHNGTSMVEKYYARWLEEDAPDHLSAFNSHMSDAFDDSSASNIQPFPEDIAALNIKEAPKFANISQALALQNSKGLQALFQHFGVPTPSAVADSQCNSQSDSLYESNPLHSHCTFSSKKMQHELRAREDSRGSPTFRLLIGGAK